MPARRPKLVGPIERPDSAPPHANPIRRFREELRLTRDEFADLIKEQPDSLRMWERTDKPTRPNGQAAVKIIELAERNFYPLVIEDIYDPDHLTKFKREQAAKKRRKR